MAVLPNNDRELLWSEYMRHHSGERSEIPLTKTELRAFFDAADNWIDLNMAAFNAALPLPARTKLSTRDKAYGFMLILRRRFELS